MHNTRYAAAAGISKEVELWQRNCSLPATADNAPSCRKLTLDDSVFEDDSVFGPGYRVPLRGTRDTCSCECERSGPTQRMVPSTIGEPTWRPRCRLNDSHRGHQSIRPRLGRPDAPL